MEPLEAPPVLNTRAPSLSLEAKIFRGLVMAAAIGVLLWIAALGLEVWLLAFGGLLMSLALTSLRNLLLRVLPLRPRRAMMLALALLLGLGGLFGWLLAPQLVVQLNELTERVPSAWRSLRENARDFPALSKLMQGDVDWADLPVEPRRLLTQTRDMLSSTMHAAGSFAVLLFIGVTMALEPGMYRRGMLALVPAAQKPLAERWLEALIKDLRAWLLSRLCSMAAIGILSALGLWWLEVPLALAMGLLAGALSFIPFIGPLLAVVPPLLLALSQSWETALWVLGLYVAIQTVESYLLEPLLERHLVALPPALTLMAVTLLSAMAGLLGTALAAPLTVLLLTSVRLLYVEPMREREQTRWTAPALPAAPGDEL